jgi:hypothetical protein
MHPALYVLKRLSNKSLHVDCKNGCHTKGGCRTKNLGLSYRRLSLRREMEKNALISAPSGPSAKKRATAVKRRMRGKVNIISSKSCSRGRHFPSLPALFYEFQEIMVLRQNVA